MMAWTKAKTAVVVGVCVLLAAGTAAIIIYNMGKPMRSIRAEWSAISGDSEQWSWANGKIKAHTVTGDSIFASREEYGDVTFSAVASTTNPPYLIINLASCPVVVKDILHSTLKVSLVKGRFRGIEWSIICHDRPHPHRP